MKPPRRSAESDCWFLLITFNFYPVFSAKDCTPVSPTKKTGWFLTKDSLHQGGYVTGDRKN